MPDAILKLESIGDNYRHKLHLHREGRLKLRTIELSKCKSLRGRKPFVKIVTGVTSQNETVKKEIKGNKSYIEANTDGGRGVYYYYSLQEGHCYYVQEQISWKKSIKYYVLSLNGALEKMTKDQALRFIKSTTLVGFN